MKKEIQELSEKQIEKMLPILKERVLEMAVLRGKYKNDQPRMLRYMQQLQEQTDEKLDAILTPQQKSQLKSFAENT